MAGNKCIICGKPISDDALVCSWSCQWKFYKAVVGVIFVLFLWVITFGRKKLQYKKLAPQNTLDDADNNREESPDNAQAQRKEEKPLE